MKLYVFENVLRDYTSGMAVIAADSPQRARELAYKEIGWGDSMEEFLAQSGFNGSPTGCYDVHTMPEGVKHFVYGGS